MCIVNTLHVLWKCHVVNLRANLTDLRHVLNLRANQTDLHHVLNLRANLTDFRHDSNDFRHCRSLYCLRWPTSECKKTNLVASINKYTVILCASTLTFKDSGNSNLVMMFSMGFGQLRIGGGRVPWCTAHMIRKAGPPISSNGLRLVKTSHRIIPQLNTSHFSLYTLPVINTKHEFLQYVKTIYQY